MWLSLLIATIIMVGFLATSLWIKIYFEKGRTNSKDDCELQNRLSENPSACDHCGLKDFTNCSVPKTNSTK